MPRASRTKPIQQRHRRSPRSKIAHLPPRLKDGIVRRLCAGWSQKAVLKWLNADRSARLALRRERSGNGVLYVSAQNLSLWLQSNPPQPST